MDNRRTLYEELGDERLKQLLDTFYDKVFSSPVIGPLFDQTNQETIKDKQYCFLTQFLGGPPRYNEKYGHPRMRMRHLPHKIDEAAKNEWLKLMKESINTLEWDEQLKNALYSCFPAVANHMQNS
ncbi:MAG: globin [Flavobacteriales bacterium]|jgi:hemoglobin|nr:globin [Flavobacteriales bacterium]